MSIHIHFQQGFIQQVDKSNKVGMPLPLPEIFPPHNLIASNPVFCYHSPMVKKALSSLPSSPRRLSPAGNVRHIANRTALPPPSDTAVPRPGGPTTPSCPRVSAAQPTDEDTPRSPAGELVAWLAKYEPVERAILEARERRLRNRAARRAERALRFGDLCEASEGLATVWRRRSFPAREMLEWAGGDRFTLWAMAPFLRRRATEEVNALRRRLTRPLYYERENERRRALAAKRRRIRKRRTENPCPTREAILDAWTHAREGREAMLRFGSLLEDLACYVDHELRIADGRIVGRAPGIKGWLRENIPALALRYTTVMRYKAAAKKLRQVVELPDPIPVAAVLDGGGVLDGTGKGTEGKEPERDYGAEKSQDNDKGEVRSVQVGREVEREMAILRARGIYLEAMAGIQDVVTRVLERINALLDPRRVEEANMLASWRARYARAVTGRTTARWRDRLFRSVG